MRLRRRVEQRSAVDRAVLDGMRGEVRQLLADLKQAGEHGQTLAAFGERGPCEGDTAPGECTIAQRHALHAACPDAAGGRPPCGIGKRDSAALERQAVANGIDARAAHPDVQPAEGNAVGLHAQGRDKLRRVDDGRSAGCGAQRNCPVDDQGERLRRLRVHAVRELNDISIYAARKRLCQRKLVR